MGARGAYLSAETPEWTESWHYRRNVQKILFLKSGWNQTVNSENEKYVQNPCKIYGEGEKRKKLSAKLSTFIHSPLWTETGRN